MPQIQLVDYGDAHHLHFTEAPVPTPGTGEVLIRVEAAGVNFSDVLRRRNTYFMPTPLPYVLGAEAVGTIEALGEGPLPPGIGTGVRVLAILPYGGAYGGYVTAPAHFCVPLPPHLDAAAATALFVQGTTAWLLLHKTASSLAGKSVLIHAAAGGVGSLLVQLARLGGASRIIGTASSAEKRALIARLGADAAIDYTQPDWPEQVKAANDGQPVDLIFEMVGGEVFNQSFACLAIGGEMVVYGAASGVQGAIQSERLVDTAHQVRSFNLAHFIAQRMPEWQEALGTLIGLMAEGKLQVHSLTFPLAEAARAHDLLERRLTAGKVVLLP